MLYYTSILIKVRRELSWSNIYGNYSPTLRCSRSRSPDNKRLEHDWNMFQECRSKMPYLDRHATVSRLKPRLILNKIPRADPSERWSFWPLLRNQSLMSVVQNAYMINIARGVVKISVDESSERNFIISIFYKNCELLNIIYTMSCQ